MGELSTIEKNGEIIVMSKRCTGHCCDKFTFKFSPKEFQSIADSFKKKDEWVKENGKENIHNCPELFWIRNDGKEIKHNLDRVQVEKINDMLIYRGVTSKNPATGEDILNHVCRNEKKVELKKDWLENQLEWAKERGYIWNSEGRLESHTYTCKHFDKESGNCGIYADRPDMCKFFPGHKECSYTECTGSCAKKD